MPEKTRHQPGAFCWIEAATTDARSARTFYESLFGWTSEDFPTGPESSYTILRLRGRDIGGLYQLDEARKARGVVPHWLTYVAVASADESAEKARSMGATVLQPPFDAQEFGRMAVVQDPQGAVFAIWQAKKHPGAGLVNETGTWGWCELATSDEEAARRFYTKLFGWGAKVGSAGPMTYTEWQLGGTSIGGCLKLDPSWGPVPAHWLVYFMVDDCDAAVAKTKSLGGSVTVPPQDVPNVGRFSVLADPAGAAFAVIRLLTPPASGT